MPTTYAIPNGRTAMDATIWSGNGAAATYTNTDNGTVGFTPDLVWIKNRSNATFWNVWFDTVRGVGNQISSNQSDAQLANASNVAGKVSAFNSNGFTLAAGSSSINSVNGSGSNYVGWQWNAGSNTTVSNTSGSITSTVSANATAGFSILQFTTQTLGSTGTVGHGLGATPDMIIYKHLNEAADFITYHSSVGATKYLDMTDTIAATTNANVWNNTAPTSTVFTLGTSPSGSKLTVAYCWRAVPGFSAFGSYTGNNSANGPFIYTGFRPKWILIKNTSTTGYWMLVDTVRGTYNIVGPELYPNVSDAEDTSDRLDILSNGFKIRVTSAFINGNGNTMVYACFAENPFKYANAR